jgi:hypothetical protein
MATEPSNLTGLFKEVYGDSVENLIPDAAKLTKRVPFVPKAKQNGNKYNQPVVVNQEAGFTYAGPTDGAFALNDAVSMQLENAEVQGSQCVLRSALAYDSAAMSANSKAAFLEATELLVENMMESSAKRLEISSWYGRLGIAAVVLNSDSNVSATRTSFTISAASWSSGIWSGLEGAKLQFYRPDLTTLISSGADSIFTVYSVNPGSRVITVDGTATGITALDTAIGSYAVVPFFNGSNGKEMYGIDYIIQNTGSLFGIDAAVYDLWKSNVVTVSGQLTMGKILSAVSVAVGRGLNEDLTVWVSPATWANLASDLAALRMYDGSYNKSKAENGMESICYYGQNGKIEIISHNIIHDGDCFGLPLKRVKRLGAQDISFKTPGRDDEIFLQLPSNAGFELRNYYNQAVFIETPARCFKITGFTNS